jgi:CheY-like chemotaxis protein/anti-sigma regulatory factor (Ser/Thr protein kinase)
MEHTSTVLIVDDQTLEHKKLGSLLTGQGYNLAFASSGVEALAEAAELVPDVILLDVMMPGMDGFEVCRRLRADSLLAEVPIIMITALEDPDSRLQGIEAGADDFVSKPFDGVELKARVRSITRLNRYRRLLAERLRFRWVMEQADEGYLMVGESDEVLYANPRARLYLGLPVDDGKPITMPFLKLAREQYHGEPEETWWNWPKQPVGQSPRYLVRPESPNARAFWLQVDVLSLPAGSDMAQTVRLRDVTAQMNMLRDMRGFHAIIMHKLSTPVGPIVSSLDFLAQHYRAELSNVEVAELFEVALKSGQRLRREIEDVLQYVRDLPVLARPGKAFSLSQLQSMLAKISTELDLEFVSVSYQQCPGDARVLLSQQAVELVLWEILENARKFHPQQAPIVEVSVSCPSSKEVRLRISDDGLTLSPEQLAQVWTPYYQAEKRFTGEVAGMGLGLTMVATLVWGIGGTCRIRNRVPGPGVVVELVLPLE